MKCSIEIEVQPFDIPSMVHQTDPKADSIPLDRIDRETIVEMCIDFEQGVLKAAGHEPRAAKRPVNSDKTYDFEKLDPPVAALGTSWGYRRVDTDHITPDSQEVLDE